MAMSLRGFRICANMSIIVQMVNFVQSPLREWPSQNAKNRFSALVNAALAGEPQQVTRRGRPDVVVLAADEYERLLRLDRADAPALGELLTQIPQDDQDFERISVPALPLSG